MISDLSIAYTNPSISNKRLKILYVGMKYDEGKPEQGYSFEHYNFYESLIKTGHEIIYFDFMSLLHQYGHLSMNSRLMEIVKVEKPDLMFTFLFTNELDPKIVREISENTDTITLNWFADDHWRFDNFSCFWAPCFNWVVTTAESALPKYAQMGYHNVIKSQWGCNHFLYRKLDLPLKYDVTFVGQPHSNRRQVIEALVQSGIKVHVWGKGWNTGRLSQVQMIEVFNQSRINLNLQNSFMVGRRNNYAKRLASRCLDLIPYGDRVKIKSNELYNKFQNFLSVDSVLEQPKSHGQQNYAQIKGRNFEVPGCGGFVLTGKAENLEDYYQISKEVECFDNNDDLINQIKYYLKNEEQRIAIAKAGYERTLNEHTYVNRFNKIFQKIGLIYQ
ncbi:MULTISPECIES: glycosyltransferase family protein [unclassified Anabaena]|uniref:CgeB family protein n=1 Tax=unclassified Anabaena TaxID=2619674 RepID=UPI0039C6DE5F